MNDVQMHTVSRKTKNPFGQRHTDAHSVDPVEISVGTNDKPEIKIDLDFDIDEALSISNHDNGNCKDKF